MSNKKWLEIWRFREANDVKQWHKTFMLFLVVAGFLSIIKFADWWFRSAHIGFLPLYIVLSFIVWYGILRMAFIWINYLRISKPKYVEPKENLTVAIFTTSSPGEPLSMFDKTLEACARIEYPHTTYLLDDTQDLAFKAVAEKHGAVWLELVGLPGAKAGKVNKAIEFTDEEFILIMDPDHIPFPNFLDEVLGQFKDKKIGFVQVAQAYYNQYRSFTALGAAEQTYTFYGPTLMGMYGYGASVAIGANCTFRRRALESIGGHGIGLAEDLITSIRLHAKGWKSVFVPSVVSRGLVPEDFGSFSKQQLKWARGVHEVLFAELPVLWKDLTNWQRITYFLIGTYYLVGATSFVYFIIPYLYFWTDLLPAKMYFTDFLINITPIGIIAVAVYLFAQNWLSDKPMEYGMHLRGMVLKFANWPIYFMGFLLSLINTEIPYIPTAKKADIGHFTPFARPLIIQLVVFLLTVFYVIYKRKYIIPESELALTTEITWGMLGFASIAMILVIAGIYAAWQSKHMTQEEPWAKVNLDDIVVVKRGQKQIKSKR